MTDHLPLVRFIENEDVKEEENRRLMNLHWKYENYRFKVSYSPGLANSADALSQGVEDPEEGLAEGYTSITYSKMLN